MTYPGAFFNSVLTQLFWLGVVIAVIVLLARTGRKKGSAAGGAQPDPAARLEQVERRLAAVEQRLAQMAGPAPAAAPAQAPAAAAVCTGPPPRRTTVASQAPPRRTGGVDLEALIGGKLLNRVGILAILFAVGFFLKYAFDNNWLGNRGRIAIGLLLGSGLLLYSQILLRRGYLYFSEGIAGLGAGVLYLSVFAGWSFYHLFPQAVAFAGMIIITAAMVAIALGRDSQRIAWIALVGGFATPILVSTGKDQQVILFGYLAVLDASLLVLARAKAWRSLELLAFAATELFFWEWMGRFYRPSRLSITAGFATFFFALFASLPVIRSRAGRLGGDQVVLVLLNALAFLGALHRLLWPDHRWILTVAVLALAAVHLLVTRGLRRAGGVEAEPVRLLFAGLALTFVTLAIPIRLDGAWITIAWAVEGAVLVFTGLRIPMRFLRSAGLFLFLLAALRLCTMPLAADRLFWNLRFGTFLAMVACYALALVFCARRKEVLAPGEAALFAPLGVAANVFLLWGLSLEVWDVLGPAYRNVGIDTGLARQLGLSLLWLLYASVLITAGVRRKAAALRWQALILFGIVVMKVFLFDLSFLERFYRIVSFVVLGVVLLVVSFLYQRRLAAGSAGEKP